jgi:hypothetical protein
MLSPAIARELRSRGHDVQALQEHPEWCSFDDPVDMRPLHYEAITPGGPGDYGMIFIPGGRPRTRADTGRIVAALEQKLAAHPGDDDLASGEDWL